MLRETGLLKWHAAAMDTPCRAGRPSDRAGSRGPARLPRRILEFGWRLVAPWLAPVYALRLDFLGREPGPAAGSSARVSRRGCRPAHCGDRRSARPLGIAGGGRLFDFVLRFGVVDARGADDASLETQLCATLLGIAGSIFLMTFLARLPVNYPAVYVVLLAIPVIADIRGTGRRFAASIRALRIGKTFPRTQMLSFALLVFMLGIHWLIVPQPESSADGLAMHLAIPVNISLHHMFTYRPDRILWSVMPMGADWCYSMVYLLGGEYAARLLNFAMLLLLEALLYRAVRRWVTPAVAFLILALFASTSLVQMVTGSLFIENFLAAMVVGMVLAIWRFGESGQRRFLYAAAGLGGTALAIKLGGLAYAIAALPLAAIEVRRQWRRMGSRPALACGIALVLLLAAALPAYALSWRLTGDPVFPFLNQKFPSPILDRSAVLSDYRFHEPLTLHTPFDLTFHSNRYYEGRPGSLGFQGLLLVPLGLLALLAINSRRAWYAAAVSVAGSLIVLEFLPNARYLYPSMPLMLVPLAALFGWLPPGTLRRALIALAVAAVGLNAWFLPFHGMMAMFTVMP